MLPRWRCEYETRAGSATESALIDRWLWANHGTRVAVPRWPDALTFGGLGSPTTIINLTGGTTTDRCFTVTQRIMLWDSASRYETLTLVLVDSGFIQTTVAPSLVWTAGSTKVVPLLPARLDASLALKRPNGSLGVAPLGFEVEVVQ